MVNILWFFLTFYFVSWTNALEIPTVNLDSVGGQLGFIGNYAGLSVVKESTQFESLPNNTHGLVLTELDESSLIFKLFSKINGSITSICKLSETQYIFGGEFNSINETIYNHIVQFDTVTRQLLPLEQGLDGRVRSIYCDSDQVYVGGDFIAPINGNVTEFTGHIALWKENKWNPLPWKGFNGPIYSIIKQEQQQSILFAGRFDSTGDGQFFNQNTSQTINLLSSAIISAGNSAMFGNNTNPSSVICSQSPWLLQDGMPGYWEAQFDSPVQPSVFRLSNVNLEGKNTNEFNIISLGSNQYFQLSYIDPVTNEINLCSNKCILSNDTTIPYQDFTVTSPLTTNGLRINIDSWFGSGGGLGSVEIFRSDVSLQPQLNTNNDASTPSSCSNTPSSIASTTGTWSQVYSYQTYRNFLIATFPATELSTTDVSVTYQPYISSQGNYDVYATTPGCVGTSTCDQRTQVILDITLNPDNTTSYALDQQNAADQRTLIYSGPISSSTGSFQPSIIMRVSPTATVPSSGTVSIAADSFEFIRNTTGSLLSSILNYYPSNNSWLPLPQQLPATSTVHTLQSNGNKIYIGGNFKSNTTFANVVAYDFDTGFMSLQNTGLNNVVSTSVLVGSQLIVGGLFNNTQVPSDALNHVAVYNLDTNTWSSMNNGVDGPVDYLYSTDNNNVQVSGDFNTANGSPAYNNAQWDLTKQQWTTSSSSLIVGSIANQIELGDNQTLYLGSIKNGQTYRANNIASLEKQQWKSSLIDIDSNAIVNTGVFWKNENKDTIILGGLFNLNNQFFHIVMYDGTEWKGLSESFEGQINTLYVVKNYLLIGGQFNGTADGVNAISFAVYNLQRQVFEEVQGILNNDQSPGEVNVIRTEADGKSIFVAGNFSYAGLLNCGSICALASDSKQWTQVSQGIEGSIKDMSVYKNSITVVGDLKVGSIKTGLAVLDNLSTASWRSPSNTIVSTTSLVNDGTGQFIVSGRSDNQFYLGTWSGNELKKMDTNLGPSTDILQLMYLPVDSSPSKARYPSNSNTVLVAVGHLELPEFGSASAALFDGETWYPYILTSTGNGTSGTIHTTFAVTACCTFESVRRYLSIPAVILISIAISLAILFVLIALAFLYLFFKRRNNVKYEPAPMQEWRPKHRPSSLLAMLDAAQLSNPAFLTTSAAAGGASLDKRRDTSTGFTTALDDRGQQSMDISDTSRLRTSSGFSAGMSNIPFSMLMANALKSNDLPVAASEESPKVFYAKYPFEAKEFGELAFDAQTAIVVTDTSDDVWWMGYKDDGSGNPISGLFPSNYVSKAKPF